jgi:hypothetical protein
MSSDDDFKVKLERLATPTVSEPDEIPDLQESRRKPTRRVANIYDAVAGYFSPSPDKLRDTH